MSVNDRLATSKTRNHREIGAVCRSVGTLCVVTSLPNGRQSIRSQKVYSGSRRQNFDDFLKRQNESAIRLNKQRTQMSPARWPHARPGRGAETVRLLWQKKFVSLQSDSGEEAGEEEKQDRRGRGQAAKRKPHIRQEGEPDHGQVHQRSENLRGEADAGAAEMASRGPTKGTTAFIARIPATSISQILADLNACGGRGLAARIRCAAEIEVL
jgi:hypothetical protein